MLIRCCIVLLIVLIRQKPNVPKLQIGFFKFIVEPLFQNWAKLIPSVEHDCVRNLTTNKYVLLAS